MSFGSSMLALLATRRWIAFTLTVVVAIVGFGFLSAWQWERAEQRRAERVELATRSQALPVTTVTAGLPEFTSITLSGAFLNGQDHLVRGKPQEGTNGFWVTSPLRPESDPGSVIWVVRGWIPARGAATMFLTPPPAPSGRQVIHGYLRDFVDAGPRPADLPPAQVTDMSLAQLPADGGLVSDRWIQSADGESGLIPLRLPEADEGRNISYAVQWLIFAVVAITGWLIFLRREALDNARAQESASAN